MKDKVIDVFAAGHSGWDVVQFESDADKDGGWQREAIEHVTYCDAAGNETRYIAFGGTWFLDGHFQDDSQSKPIKERELIERLNTIVEASHRKAFPKRTV